jgi:hypothetical protein
MMIMTGLLGAVTLSTPVSATATGGECNDNAVVKCGIYSQSDLRERYTGDVKAVYNYFGITDGMIAGTTATIRNGEVTKDGNVIVDGKVIATNAITAGRQNMTGSTSFKAGGTTFYQRSTAISFVSRDVFEAYVMVDEDGNFLGAVLKPCGNPVKATPKVVKKPSALCTAVTIHKISRTEYKFKGTASTKDGATISAYAFKITGPETQSQTVTTTATSATTDTVELKKAGTYTVTVTVKTSVGDKTGPDCTKTFTIEEEPVVTPTTTTVCNPANGQTITVKEEEASQYKPVGDVACQPKVESAKDVKPVAIASTGPADILGGVAGLGSLTAAGYYLRASRARLLSVIKK